MAFLVLACLSLLVRHSCFAVTASPPRPAEPLIISSNLEPSLRTTFQNFNFTTSLHIPNAGLPSDPYSYPIPLSELTVNFYGYGEPLGPARAVDALFWNTIHDIHRYDADQSMGTDELHWQVRNVGKLDLVLLPRSEMLWVQWDEAVRAVWKFMLDWEEVTLLFDVERMGVEYRIGTGYIMNRKT